MKHFTFNFRWLLMGLLLCLGSSAWGAEETLWEEDWSGTTNYQTPSVCTKDGYSDITYAYANGGTTTQTQQISSFTDPELLISKTNGTFTVTIPATRLTNLESTLSLQYDCNRDLSLTITNGTLGTKVTSGNTYNYPITITDNDKALVIEFKNTTSSNARFSNIKLSGTSSGGSTLTNSDLAVTGAPVSLEFDLFNNADAQTVNYTTSSTGAVTVSGGEGYVTTSVSGNSITVTPVTVTPTTQTITVNQEADGTYKAGSVTFTVDITDSTPFSGAIFDATEDKGTSPIVKDGVSFACTNGVLDNGSEYRLYKNSTTTIKTTDGGIITKIEFTNASSNPATGFGDQTGWTTNSTGGVWTGTAESVSFVASGAQVRATIIKVTVKPAAPSITVTPSSVTMDAKAGSGVLPVTCTNMPANPQLAVVFYESDGTTPATYDWITATINTDGNIDGQISVNTGAERTAYFKVCGKDADGNDVYSNLVSFTQSGPSIEMKPNSWDAAVGGDSKTFNIDDSGLTNPTFEVVFYESDGTTDATYDHSWVTTNVTSEGKLDVTVAANTGAERKAYLKVYAGSVYSDLLTINQAAAPIVYSNIPDLFAAATSTEQDVTVTFNNWVVSGVSTNGKNVFVTDNNGNGFVIYSSSDVSSTYPVGSTLSGTISCQLQLYNGFAELLNVGGLTISDGGAVTAVSIDMASLAGMNTGALVSYNNLTCTVSGTKYYLSDGATTLQVYSSLYAFGSLEAGKQYNITGVYQQYNTTKEILPRSAADIVEVVVTTPTINTTPSSLTGFTYEAGNGPSAAQTINISGSNLTNSWSAYLDGSENSNFEMSFTDNDADYYSDAGIGADQSLTFYVRMKGGLAVGDYSGALIITSKGAEPVTVPLSGSVTTPVGAPEWSALPTTPDTDITVGEEYVLDLNSYVTGDPTPTISIIKGGGIAEVVSNVFHFTPTSAGPYDFTFKAENSKGSETADFSVWANALVPSIEVSTTSINVPVTSGTQGTIEVTYKNFSNFTGTSTYFGHERFYDADDNPLTENPEKSWIIVGGLEDNNFFYMIKGENTSAEPRTVRFRIWAYDDASNPYSSELITITQAGTTVDYATLPFSWLGGTSAALTALDGVTASGLGSDYSDTHDPYNVKFDNDDDYIQIKTNEQPCKVTLGVKMIGGGKTSTITIQGSADGVTFTDVQALTISGKQNAILTLETSNDFAATDRYVRLLFTKGANVGVGPISITKVQPSITISSGYTYKMDAKAGGGELPVVCTNLAADPELAVVFCDANGDAVADDTYDWITATINANGNIDGYIQVNTGAERTAYFKVRGVDADNNDVYSNLVTFTQSAPSVSIKSDLNPWEVAASGDGHTFSIEYGGLTDPDFKVAFYESDGTTAATYDHSWVTANITTEKKLDVNVNSNDGAARSAYLKVYDTVSGLYSGLFTINQAKFEVDYATLPFEFDGGRADIETTDGLTQEGLESDYASSPYLKFNGAGDYVILKINERPGKLSFIIKGNSFSGGTFKVQTSEDGSSYTDLATYTDAELTATAIDEEFNNLGENVRYIKWVYTNKDAGNVALGKIKLAQYSTVPVVTVAKTAINVDSKENYEFVDVTYENVLGGGCEFYTDSKATTTTAAPDWVKVSFDSENDVTFTIAPNTGEERTAYVKIIGYDINSNPVYSDLITITQEGSGPVVTGQTYTLAATISSGSHYIITNSKTDGEAKAMGEQKSNNRAAVDITISGNVATVPSTAGVKEVVIYGPYGPDNDIYTIVEENQGYLYAASSSSNLLRTDADLDANGQWTIAIDDTDGFATIKAKGSNTRNWMQYNSSSTLFSCYETGQQDIYLFEKDADSYYTTEIPIAAACTDGSKYYATFSKDCAIVVPNGMTASEVGIDADNKLVVTDYLPGAIIPANTGVLLKADQAEKYQVILATGGKSVMGTNNRLRPGGVTAEQMNKFDANCLFYRLTMQGGTQLGFWWGAANGDAFNSGANKAYLAIPKASAANLRGFSFDEDATGIESAELSVKSEEGAIYDLQGRKVTNATRGLYIVNGKKVFIK